MHHLFVEAFDNLLPDDFITSFRTFLADPFQYTIKKLSLLLFNLDPLPPLQFPDKIDVFNLKVSQTISNAHLINIEDLYAYLNEKKKSQRVSVKNFDIVFENEELYDKIER